MDAEYKARIAKLEARDPVMPTEHREARIQELKTTSTMIVL